MPDEAAIQGRTRSPDDSDRLIGRILSAEQDAEAALDAARHRGSALVEGARADAQSIERRTDARLERCRIAYGAGTEALVREIGETATQDGDPGCADPDSDHRRKAAMRMARRLVGLDP